MNTCIAYNTSRKIDDEVPSVENVEDNIAENHIKQLKLTMNKFMLMQMALSCSFSKPVQTVHKITIEGTEYISATFFTIPSD